MSLQKLTKNIDHIVHLRGKAKTFLESILLCEYTCKGKPPKKMTTNFTHCANYGGGGVSKFWCVNLKKMIIFSHVELKNGRFWSVLGFKINGLKKTLSPWTGSLDEFLGWVSW